MARYQCVFFDLDHTLWDYETNCAEALDVLYDRYKLDSLGAKPFPDFITTFIKINTELWDQYDRGEIHRNIIRFERFHKIFLAMGIDDHEMSLRFSADYISESPRGKHLMPHALETLDYLVQSYPLFIITNGFDEIQSTKLASSGIDKYFKKIITSELAGHKKPAAGIFDYALAQNGVRSDQAIMIGDNLITDMGGARNAKVDHVFFNPNRVKHAEPVTYEIAALPELKNIL